MEFQHINILKRKNGITTITLNRPEKLNAMNDQTFEEMIEALSSISKDSECRVLVITGAGRDFSSGADLRIPEEGGERSLAANHPEMLRQRLRRYGQTMIRRLRSLEIPTIAMVNGIAAGIGFDLALACDLRTGSENTKFMVAFTRVGLIPGSGGAWLMPRLMGVAKAAELLFTGDFLEAQEAYRIGVINRLVPAEKLQEETIRLASRIASQPPIALRMDKVLLYEGLRSDFYSALEMAASFQAVAHATEDYKEGVAAFREKRRAVFRGE